MDMRTAGAQPYPGYPSLAQTQVQQNQYGVQGSVYAVPQPTYIATQAGYGVPQQYYDIQQPNGVIQGPYCAQGQQLAPVTTQMQVPRWANMRFLESLNSIRLVEKKDCCAGCCCFPKRTLMVYGDAHNLLGSSVAPCNCSCTDQVLLNVPEGNVVMETKKPCNLLEFLCCWLFLFDDLTIMEIKNQSGARIGSFDYSPWICRHECCVSGRYMIKNQREEAVFYVNKNDCCSLRGVYHVNVRPFGPVPCLMCTSNDIVFPMCQRWNVPVKISESESDAPIFRVKMLNKSWLEQYFCCEPVVYNLEYERSDEPREQRALLLGAALIMDYYAMNVDLFNDDNIDAPRQLM